LKPDLNEIVSPILSSTIAPAGSLKFLEAKQVKVVHSLFTIKMSFLLKNSPTGAHAVSPLTVEGTPAKVSKSLVPHETVSIKVVVAPIVD